MIILCDTISYTSCQITTQECIFYEFICVSQLMPGKRCMITRFCGSVIWLRKQLMAIDRFDLDNMACDYLNAFIETISVLVGAASPLKEMVDYVDELKAAVSECNTSSGDTMFATVCKAMKKKDPYKKGLETFSAYRASLLYSLPLDRKYQDAEIP